MDGNTGMLILYIIMGFFGFVTIVCGITFWVLWRRRKLTFINLLNDSGRWERLSLMPDKVDKIILYDKVNYKFDIKKCTRDRINRPVAHYYKGNPNQQIFDYTQMNKSVTIETEELSMKDFTTLMLSKVIRDIFQDDEVMNFLMIILVAVCFFGIATIIIVLVKKTPPVHLIGDNETINLIAQGVRQAIGK